MFEFLETLRPWREEASFIALLATISYISFGICRAGNLIGEVLYGPARGRLGASVNWLRGVVRAAAMPWHAWTLLLAFPTRRLLGARYLIELEILEPPETPPSASDYTAPRFKALHDQWVDRENKRRRDIKTLLRDRLSEEPRLFAVALRSLGQLVGIADAPRAKAAPLAVTDFPRLDDSRPVIKRYFEALKRRSFIAPADAERFLTEAKFSTGYLAPMFLITGLVNRFAEEDGWKLVLENYRKLIEGDRRYAEDLRELRSFMFNCWLLWGPSIPACTCELWDCGDRTGGGDLMMQYGYGDENNSVDILVKDGQSTDLGDRVHAFLNKHAADHLNTPFALASAPFVATGRFRWGPHLGEAEVSPAHALVAGGLDTKARQPLNGRIVFECKSTELVSASVTDSSRYYSAYLWLMFVVRDTDGRPYFPDRWKNLLVFFEHANIADATTYHALKRQLVAKASATMAAIVTEKPDITLTYACAFDDSNCGDGHGSRFPPDKLGRGGRSGVVFEDVRIRALFEEEIARLSEGHPLKSTQRLSLAPAPDSECNEYSSCHLPEMIEEFYSQLVPE